MIDSKLTTDVDVVFAGRADFTAGMASDYTSGGQLTFTADWRWVRREE